MKIELDVNPGELSKSVVEILNNLTPEQKVDVARQTMEKWLKEPYDFERLTKEREVIAHIQATTPSYREKETEQQIRGGYDFRDKMRDFKSTKEIMIKTITEGVMETYKAEVKKTIESDPKIQAMKDEVIAIIKETFPKTVHEAMVQWMASSMQTMFESTMGIRPFADHTQKTQQDLQNRLGQIEGRLAGRGI
jgi:hypothetical protein